ncbi:Hypothetical protein A7982_05424 [Minicystis rosea]|nr:Hypothetical protein A7982_05424 [Minicystis rosea]
MLLRSVRARRTKRRVLSGPFIEIATRGPGRSLASIRAAISAAPGYAVRSR